MKCFAGLDMSLERKGVRAADEKGKIVLEPRIRSEADAPMAFFSGLDVDATRICLEAGPLSQRLHDSTVEAGLPVVRTGTQQLKAMLSATVPVGSDRRYAGEDARAG